MIHIFKKYYKRIIVFAVVVAVYIVTGCPIRYLTGFCCPGCGMTRAAYSLLTLNFSDAFYYHPLVYSLPLIAAAAICAEFKLLSKKRLNIIITIWLLLMLIVYLCRLLSGSEVVFWDYTRGLLFRLVKN